ncbi:GyrI-like domain-containing protein [Mesonia sp. K7]|uniref:GyrI-like domain-containing protein n=1 Tax=Mesonia sp. K7 TaxID=2218606 RepID=UPI000DA7E55A|nr:GyrI-like domain-containing protein [Mesonia sp. K7]PZD78653.1 GyrI-like domain-containing protein [Mesonia sp. K7]
MNFSIEKSPLIKIIGKSVEMSFTENKNAWLAQQFISQKQLIENKKREEVFSIQQYSNFEFSSFSPTTKFKKWFGVEVNDFPENLDGLECLEIPAGKYLVLTYRGQPENFPAFWVKVFTEIIPKNSLEVDTNRPHFEVLPVGYNPNDENAEEQVYIPIL